MDNLNIGDTVWLKSGGPKMTISEPDGTEYKCQWFNDKKELQFAFFKATDLTTEDPNQLPTGSRL